MRAHQIMTKDVITVTPLTSILDAGGLMLRYHISGLPVLDERCVLVGMVSQYDFLHRSEIGTQRKPHRWLQFLIGADGFAADFVREHGRKVEDVMTRDPVTVAESTNLDELVHLMEKHGVHRLPVQAVASMAQKIPDPTLMMTIFATVSLG